MLELLEFPVGATLSFERGMMTFVEVGPHTMTAIHGATADITISGARVADIDFELEVVFEIDSVSAGLDSERLAILADGDVRVQVSLKAEGESAYAPRVGVATPIRDSVPWRARHSVRAGRR
jgi:hypothetical protein